uniref:Sucrose-phosphate synthase n=1 Tax=Salix viminalis TaxID=40686 RepID=A0A6N2KHD0_SALVM
MELGRDSDTGGQVKYVVELARALGTMPGVYRVDLLTRQVSAPDVDWSYGEPTEMLNLISSENSTGELGESSGSYIIRIPFGPKDKYIRKELLWPYIPEFMSKFGEQIGGGNPVWPVAIHGHYADAGDSAALLSGALNVPLVFTGHSLGRDKLEQLMKQGRQSREEINSTYKIMRRIEAEELALDASEIIITSTKQEIEEQWRLYDGFDPVLERKLRARIKRGVSCHGRFMPRTVAIPPGMEFHNITPHDGDSDGEEEKNKDHPASPDQPIWSEIMRFFSNPRKPMILALARPDPKKNITTLVKAFGECRQLRELANLTLIMGNRDDIDQMSGANASYLLSIIKLVDKYDLYGQVAYPKHHKQSDVPDIYRLAAKTKGVFINPAFIEPFGLTLIEFSNVFLAEQAAAYGLPIVATKNGGPVDIHRVLDNGLLVDPHDQQSIADALLKLVSDKQLWARCRQNGLRNIHLFSWPEHCKSYLARIACCKPRQPQWKKNEEGFQNSESDSPGDSLRDIQDLSLNLNIGRKKMEDNAVDGKNKLENAVLTLSKGAMGGLRKDGDKVRGDDYTTSSKFPSLRRRKYIFVIAVDCDTTSDFLEILKMVVDVANVNSAGLVGFILSTAMTISEINSLLNSGGLNPLDFDAFICNSGSNLYYPSSSSVDSGLPFIGLRKTLVRWAISVNDKNGQGKIVEEDEPGLSSYCFALKVKDSSLIPPVKELRKLMRIQALRCHVIYCQQGAKINVIPVLASRSQALRYLHVRWGTELSNIVVFTGECGDTDYEGLLGGLHKTVVLKGVGSSSLKLHANRNYPLEDVMPFDNPNLVQAGGCKAKDIKESLEKLGILKASAQMLAASVLPVLHSPEKRNEEQSKIMPPLSANTHQSSP